MSVSAAHTFALTAALVAGVTGTERVGNCRGRVQHVALAPRLTPGGRLRRGCRPVCGQHARRWTILLFGADPRPLCQRCRAWALRRHPRLLEQPYLLASPAAIVAALRAVTDPAELHRLVYAICCRADLVHHVLVDARFGGRRRLTALVPEARARCAIPPDLPRRTR